MSNGDTLPRPHLQRPLLIICRPLGLGESFPVRPLTHETPTVWKSQRIFLEAGAMEFECWRGFSEPQVVRRKGSESCLEAAILKQASLLKKECLFGLADEAGKKGVVVAVLTVHSMACITPCCCH